VNLHHSTTNGRLFSLNRCVWLWWILTQCQTPPSPLLSSPRCLLVGVCVRAPSVPPLDRAHVVCLLVPSVLFTRWLCGGFFIQRPHCSSCVQLVATRVMATCGECVRVATAAGPSGVMSGRMSMCSCRTSMHSLAAARTRTRARGDALIINTLMNVFARRPCHVCVVFVTPKSKPSCASSAACANPSNPL
jgi:hypothetical protein